MGAMTATCCACGADRAAASRTEGVSAVLCVSCFAALSPGTSREKCREILQFIDAPLLLMQASPRQVLTANDRALALFGKELSEAEGRRGGEVFNCVYSYTEEGCGKDAGCQDCRIKGAIVAALAGTATSDMSTLTIRRDGDAPYTLAVSAEPAGDFALVRVDRFEKERPLP